MFVLKNQESYSDEYGNSARISKKTWFKNTNIEFRGENCSVEVADGVDLMETKISLVGNSKLVVEKGCLLRGEIWVGGGAEIHIGAGTRVTSNLWMSAVAGQSIKIGEDCLIASNVKIRTHDGHPIYDTFTGELINPNAPISVGDHVWLADEVLVLKGAVIGGGAIIGARSVVSGDLPEKSLCVGVPCKPIRNDVTWEHRVGIKTEWLYE